MSYKIIEKEMYECICERCKHKWISPKLPNSCARCKSTAWNNKKKNSLIDKIRRKEDENK